MSIESFDPEPFLFSFAELRRAFLPGTFDSGLAYARAGRVLRIGPGDDEGEIQAQTKGSRPTPYRQSIRRTLARNGQQPFVGRCTCPMGWNCKHIAAVLVALAKEYGIADRPAPPPSAPATQAVVAVPSSQDAGLPPLVTAWLRELPEEGAERPAPVQRERLIYVLDVRALPRSARQLAFAPFTQAIRKDGSLGASGRALARRGWDPARSGGECVPSPAR